MKQLETPANWCRVLVVMHFSIVNGWMNTIYFRCLGKVSCNKRRRAGIIEALRDNSEELN